MTYFMDARDLGKQLRGLLARVRRGDQFTITDNGQPIARLVSVKRKNVAEVIREMEEWQEKHGPTLGPGLTIRQLREEGLRF